MIILITGNFPVFNRGLKVGEEFVVSHGIDTETDRDVIIENVHPKFIDGAYFDAVIGEWVIAQ